MKLETDKNKPSYTDKIEIGVEDVDANKNDKI